MSSILELLSGPSAIDRYLQVAQMMGSTGLGSAGQATGPEPSGGSSNWEDAAREFFLSRGYSPEDWNKVDYIIERESGWDPTAVNPSSGAAGIPQRIAGFRPGWQEDPMKQIRWLFNYLNNHNYAGYGTGIDAAYQHKQDTGWY